MNDASTAAAIKLELSNYLLWRANTMPDEEPLMVTTCEQSGTELGLMVDTVKAWEEEHERRRNALLDGGEEWISKQTNQKVLIIAGEVLAAKNTQLMVVYRSLDDLSVWVMPRDEFMENFKRV